MTSPRPSSPRRRLPPPPAPPTMADQFMAYCRSQAADRLLLRAIYLIFAVIAVTIYARVAIKVLS